MAVFNNRHFLTLQRFQLFSFCLYFVFNFVDRGLSNIFLLLTLFLCLVSFRNFCDVLKTKVKLIICILLFSVYISLVGYYHDSPISELDNYYRFLLLLPLLLISLDDYVISRILPISALAAIILWFYDVGTSEIYIRRYTGTSSSAITYAIMSSTLSMVCLFYAFKKNTRSLSLILSAVIFMYIYIQTETRGPMIGIIIVVGYLTYEFTGGSRDKKSMIISFLVVLSIIASVITIEHPLTTRLKDIAKINLTEPSLIKEESLRERTYYINYGLQEIQKKLGFGIGPQNVVSHMSRDIQKNGYKKISPRDHLHNDFLDIVLKFGFMSILLLLSIYYFLLDRSNKEHHILLNILMIMLVTSQLTQSHLSHHQAITFFVTLFYVLQTKSIQPKVLK